MKRRISPIFLRLSGGFLPFVTGRDLLRDLLRVLPIAGAESACSFADLHLLPPPPSPAPSESYTAADGSLTKIHTMHY